MGQIRYIIEYAVDIEESLNTFPKSIRKMIRDAIDKKLTHDPIAYGKPLRYSLKGHRRLRVVDYRVIYRIIEEKVVVFIVDIDARKDIYD